MTSPASFGFHAHVRRLAEIERLVKIGVDLDRRAARLDGDGHGHRAREDRQSRPQRPDGTILTWRTRPG